MEINLIILNFLLYTSVLVLSLVIMYTSKLGLLGLKAKNLCQTSTIIEILILILLIFTGIMFILSLIQLFLHPNIKPEWLYVNDSNNNQDPVRWWPSGTPQSWGIIGGAIGVYRLVPGTPRTKAIAALTSLGITVPSAVWFHAVENPNGFNRFVRSTSMMEYKRTGSWPATVPDVIPDNRLNPVFDRLSDEATRTANFLGDGNYFQDLSLDGLFNFFIQFFRPVHVHGYLDDLIGQQIFIYLLMLLIVVSLIILFSLYTLINIMLHNKEFIRNKFNTNNKFIVFFINYQIILSKISIFLLPLIIVFGLIELFVGLHYLITHPLPLEELPVDLHTYIPKK